MSLDMFNAYGQYNWVERVLIGEIPVGVAFGTPIGVVEALSREGFVLVPDTY